MSRPSHASAWPQILTQVKAIGFYVHLLAAPIHLSVEQQFEVLDMAGGWGWDNVINASDSTVLAMADRVTEFLAEAH